MMLLAGILVSLLTAAFVGLFAWKIHNMFIN